MKTLSQVLQACFLLALPIGGSIIFAFAEELVFEGMSLWGNITCDEQECQRRQTDLISQFANMPESLASEVESTLLPFVERWSGVRLESTFTYGFRRYVRGNRLLGHVDKSSKFAEYPLSLLVHRWLSHNAT